MGREADEQDRVGGGKKERMRRGHGNLEGMGSDKVGKFGRVEDGEVTGGGLVLLRRR